MVVVWHLTNSKKPWQQDMLYDAARNDPDSRVRLMALRALDSRIDRNLQLLKEAALGENPWTTLAALDSLVHNPDTDKLPWREQFITPPVTAQGIYYAAALLAAGRSREEATKYLKEALYSESPTLRQKLLGALTLAGTRLDGIEILREDPNPEVLFSFCIYARKMGREAKERVAILENFSRRTDDLSIRALVALSEEKIVAYGQIRNRIWERFRKGKASDKKYLLSFVGLSINDPPLALEAMQDDDPEVRLHAAAAYLRTE